MQYVFEDYFDKTHTTHKSIANTSDNNNPRHTFSVCGLAMEFKGLDKMTSLCKKLINVGTKITSKYQDMLNDCSVDTKIICKPSFKDEKKRPKGMSNEYRLNIFSANDFETYKELTKDDEGFGDTQYCTMNYVFVNVNFQLKTDVLMSKVDSFFRELYVVCGSIFCSFDSQVKGRKSLVRCYLDTDDILQGCDYPDAEQNLSKIKSEVIDDRKDEKHIATPRTMSYSGGVKLSNSSIKKLEEFEYGDILYATSSAELVGDSQTNGIDNTPIAICISSYGVLYHGDDHCPRFMALNTISPMTPDEGCRYPFADQVIYGGMVSNMRKLINVEEWKIADAYRYVSTDFQRTELHWNDGFVSPNNKADFPLLICTWRFHTIGTKRGDWYPMGVADIKAMAKSRGVDEKASDNIKDLNRIRKSLGYRSLSTSTTLFCGTSGDNILEWKVGKIDSKGEPEVVMRSRETWLTCFPMLKLKK